MLCNPTIGLNALLTKRNVFILAATVLLGMLMLSLAYAGQGGMEFEDVWMEIKDWSQGTLGRIIAGAMILVGLVGGIVRQSLIALALGIGGGLGVYNAPEIIESLVSATLTHAPSVTTTTQLANGLF